MSPLRKLSLRIYRDHLLPYKWSVLVSWIFLLGAQITALMPALLYKRFFNTLTSPDAMTTGVREMVMILMLVVGAYGLMNVCYRIAEYNTIRYVARVMADINQTCFAYLHRHSNQFFSNNFAGALVKKVNRFVNSFQVLFDSVFWDLHGIAVRIIVTVTILMFLSVWLGLILLVWTAVFISIAYIFIKKKLVWDVARAKQDSVVTGVLADTVANESNVKFLVGYERENNRFKKETRQQQWFQEGAWTVNFYLNMVQGFLLLVVEFGMMYYSIFLWRQGLLTVGDFVLIQAYISTIIIHVWDMSHIMRRLYEGFADAEEMAAVFDTPHEIVDSKSAQTLVVPRGEIVFDNVSFSYNKTREIIANLNLEISSSQRVAFVGHSGAGKSTIVKLLLRSHDVTSGKLLIDGQRIDKVTLESLWQNVSYVPQDPILFHRTLMDNIRYGKPDATDAEVMEAARLAHAHEFIQTFGEQYDTFVGERGVKLSGGERQRVAIARAILKNSPILILDEATSSLDSESERLIQDALQNLMKGKTVIVIAHRLSTIMAMDRILVIEDGEVVEDGTHKQLLRKKNGFYKKLWDIQAGTFIGE